MGLMGLMSHISRIGRIYSTVSSRQRKPRSANSFDDMKAGCPKGLYRLRQLPVSHQHIIGIKGTDRQDTDTGMSQWNSHRNENTDQIEIERPLNLDGPPAPTSSHFVSAIGIGAD